VERPRRTPKRRSRQPWLRKATRNRGQILSERAALEVLYLAVRNLDDYRGPASEHAARLEQAVQAFTIYFDGSIPIP
jgi:hypothetical protein